MNTGPTASQEPAGGAIEATLVPTYPGGFASPCGPGFVGRWRLTLDALQGRPWPALPELPGRVVARPWSDPGDDGPTDDELAPFTAFCAQRQPQAERLQAAAERRKAERLAQQRADRARGSVRRPTRRKPAPTTEGAA